MSRAQEYECPFNLILNGFKPAFIAAHKSMVQSKRIIGEFQVFPHLTTLYCVPSSALLLKSRAPLHLLLLLLLHGRVLILLLNCHIMR